MKPANFEYFRPGSIDEALAIFANLEGKEVKLLGGGQSLLPMMNFRLTSPAALIDLNRIPSLAFIEERDRMIEIGSMTRQRSIEFSSVIAERLPILRDAVKLVGHLPTRTRGTIGGSLAHADPSAELPLIAVLLDAVIVVRGPLGERDVMASDFFESLMGTALAKDEIITKVRFPILGKYTGHAIEELSRRSGDFAIASAAAIVDQGSKPDTQYVVRLAVGGVGPIPIRLHRTEEFLQREGLGDLRDACALASEEVAPMTDHNASAAFRRHLAQVLVERVLTKAIERSHRR